MRIVIDARMYGPKHTGNGVYTQNLIENLAKIDEKNNYIILLRKNMMDKISLPENWEKVEADYRHYSIYEQINLPILLNKLKPDLVHFLHFNVPVFYNGRFIVTIHDLIMHKFRGRSSTTKSLFIYPFVRFGYFISFAKAVFGATKIIVPSKWVKKQLVDYYRLKSQKVEVVYE